MTFLLLLQLKSQKGQKAPFRNRNEEDAQRFLTDLYEGETGSGSTRPSEEPQPLSSPGPSHTGSGELWPRLPPERSRASPRAADNPRGGNELAGAEFIKGKSMPNLTNFPFPRIITGNIKSHSV